MKKLWLIRKDEEAVTPVIAVILMVAITIVLVSTLYLMVSSLIPGSVAGDNTIDVVITQKQDGNWTLTVSRMDNPGIPIDSVRLTIYNRTAVIKLNRAPLSALTMTNWTSYHAVYHGRPGAGLSVGDNISIFMKVEGHPQWGGYESGYIYSIISGTALLTQGTL